MDFFFEDLSCRKIYLAHKDAMAYVDMVPQIVVSLQSFAHAHGAQRSLRKPLYHTNATVNLWSGTQNGEGVCSLLVIFCKF